MLYQVLLPSSVSISSFTHLSKVFFALLTTSSEVNGHRVRVLRNIYIIYKKNILHLVLIYCTKFIIIIIQHTLITHPL